MGLGRKGALAVVLSSTALLAGGAGCGEEEETEVVEGEPIELGDLHINVQLTRFLNPADREDREYLEGLSPPPSGQSYLAVFMEIENESDEDVRIPAASDLTVVDTTGVEYEPLESETVFSLQLGSNLRGGGELPAEDTAAASGPVQGSIILFLVDQGVEENRPLELEIHADGEDGLIELDI